MSRLDPKGRTQLYDRHRMFRSTAVKFHRYPDVLVAFDVASRTPSRAFERADPEFSRFENAIRYMMAIRDRRWHIGILDRRSCWNLEGCAVSDDVVMSCGQTKGPFQRVDLAEAFFADTHTGNAKLWDLFRKSNRTELEKRVLTAVNWIGKGVNELDDPNAFVQFMFAIESLLKFDAKEPFNPSIVASISEMAAFMLSDSCDGRCAIEQKVKAIYTSRSKIVHGHKMTVSAGDVVDALDIAKSLVVTLLTNISLSDKTSIEDIRNWVRVRKYGGIA